MEIDSFERAVLSSIMFEPKIIGNCIAAGLKAEHFYHPFRKKLFYMLVTLQDSIIDEEIIKKRMKKEFDEHEMILIMSSNPLAKPEVYINEIMEESKIRETKKLALGLLENISNKSAYKDLLKQINSGLDRLMQENSSFLNIYGINSINAQEAEFICQKWLPFPKRAVSMVTASGGVGKSFLMMQAAMRIIDENGLKVFMWLSEDPLELSRYRFEKIANEIMRVSPGGYDRYLSIAGSDSETVHFLEESKGLVSTTAEFYQFKSMLKSYDVIILDPLIAMYGGDENNNTHARQFINMFTRWATTENKTIIFIHHGTKNTSQSRGASAFVDAVRLVYQVEIIKDGGGNQIENDRRMITLAKDNNGAKKYLDTFQVKRKIFPKKKPDIVLDFQGRD
jgi:replicative DNA helicase